MSDGPSSFAKHTRGTIVFPNFSHQICGSWYQTRVRRHQLYCEFRLHVEFGFILVPVALLLKYKGACLFIAFSNPSIVSFHSELSANDLTYFRFLENTSHMENLSLMFFQTSTYVSFAGARQGLLVRGADVLERLAGKENPQFLVLHLSTMKNCCCSCRRWDCPSASNAASIILLGNKLSQFWRAYCLALSDEAKLTMNPFPDPAVLNTIQLPSIEHELLNKNNRDVTMK
ncbi:hypothetical protein ACFX2I_042993 [Malus domestica]